MRLETIPARSDHSTPIGGSQSKTQRHIPEHSAHNFHCTGIEDGASLAICLALSGGTSADVPRALEAFQAIRQPRVLQCLENGHRQRDLWHSYMSSLCASNLDLLIATAYDHDAELHAMNSEWPYGDLGRVLLTRRYSP